jgi:hypothetical protein
MGYVVDKVAMGQVSLRVLQLPPVKFIPPVLQFHVTFTSIDATDICYSYNQQTASTNKTLFSLPFPLTDPETDMRVPEPIWTLWRRENSLIPARNRTLKLCTPVLIN